jgi:fumarylacetoacetase
MKSFIDVAPESHFPIQNLPYGAFTTPANPTQRIGVAIGDFVLDVSALESAGLLDTPDHALSQPTLNAFMALGRQAWKSARERLQDLLRDDNPAIRDNADLRATALIPMQDVTLHMPVKIGDYTDFYSSREHAANVGMMFRSKENALLPNWLHLPVGYHGRASSVILSGIDIRRPYGQIKTADADAPIFAPSDQMDFELEMGFFIGPGNQLGEPIPVTQAMDHIFGMVLVNDWSARDIQRWEYQPLGPFLAKNLATTISPWIVTMDALEPFRIASPEQNPTPLPYLQSDDDLAYDIQLEVRLQSPTMTAPVVISRTNFKYMYWNICQQLAHHSITGCNMRPGDLLASGTISGSTPDSYGSMLELTWGGTKPLHLPDGTARKFLHDGDKITLTGVCKGDDFQIGFGEATATLLPAKPR